MSTAFSDIPVILPPDRARLCTNPLATGSPADPMTMGMVVVAFCAAPVGCDAAVTMTSTFSFTSSAARPLPRAARITEVDLDVGGQREALVPGHLLASIPGERLVHFLGELPCVLDERIDDRLRVLARNLDQHHVSRLTFHQRCDLAAATAEHQISFPVAGHGAVLNGRRPFADRYGANDPPVNVSLLRVMPRPTHAARAPQVLEELLLQGAARLDEEAAVDGLV